MERNSNVFKFQGSNMIVSAKGPNIDRKMNMSTSFRSNLMSSTMNMPRNFEKQISTMSVGSQRSIYYGRETSPTASVRSDMQPRNFHQSFYQRGYPQRSVYNGRGGSPVSMRSIDSSASRATEIVELINSGNFNRQEWKMIQEAFARSNRRKYDYRKKVEKRRKMKMYFKNLRNGSGDDSGEQGSNSSISSDDCASTRTGYSRRYNRNYKENIPRSTASTDYPSKDMFQIDNRDAYRGYSEIDSQNPYRRDNGFQGDMDHPANMLPYQKNSQFGNMYLSERNGPSHNQSTYSQNKSVIGSTNTFYNQKYMTAQTNISSTQKNTLNSSVCSTKSMQNMTMMSQKDRFKGGFQFPSQKFNKSSTLCEEQQVHGRQLPNNQHTTKNKLYTEHIEENSDENDDIFLNTTETSKSVPKKRAPGPKRKAESLDDIPVSAKKKPKTASNTDKSKIQTQNTKGKVKEFEFVKPQFPIRKSAPAKTKEKLISKSVGAPDIVFSAPEEKDKPCPEPAEPEIHEPEIEPDPEPLENTQLTNSDMSMRPSFLKRKLFTQTLDVTERKNNSSDSLGTDSPQSNIYSALTREKHKTRKLVTSQSLLSRDVNQDDNNLLDLIHKIVPPNQVNSTITSNITKSFNSRVSGNKPDGDDKFDITSIISTCNNDSVSETYTDDENIFKVNNDDKKKKPQEKPPTKQVNTEVKSKTIPTQENKGNNSCTKKVKIILNKVAVPVPPKVQTPVKSCPGKPVVTSNNIDRFWDSDVESDYERATPRPQEPVFLREEAPNPIVNSKNNNPEVRPTNLSMKFTKINKNHELSPVAKKKDTTLVKVLKQQTSKKTPNKSETKTVKKSNENTKTLKKTIDDKKTSKKLNDDKQQNKFNEDSQSLKSERPKRGTPTITFKTRKQINLSATSDTVNKASVGKKGPSPNKTLSNNDKTSQIKKKQSKEKKSVQENSKTNPPQKDKARKQNDSQPKTKTKVETPRSQSRTKTTKLLNDAEQIETSVCKILRSRVVDLSSSFNSDKFELTMSRTRKSRTPCKRISFNKSKNLLINNKTRNRATKA